jgi:DNA-binding transcriptional regulator YhcF (GntR family)
MSAAEFRWYHRLSRELGFLSVRRMLCELTCAELTEHRVYDQLEAEAGMTAAQRREEERLMREATGQVKKRRKRH